MSPRQNNHTRVQWRLKMESELCVCTVCRDGVCPRSTHTRIWRTAKPSDKTNQHWIHPHYLSKTWKFLELSIGQQLSQQTQHNTLLIELHYSNNCQQFSAYIYSTHVLTSNWFWVGAQCSSALHSSTCGSTYMNNTRPHSCMQLREHGEWDV